MTRSSASLLCFKSRIDQRIENIFIGRFFFQEIFKIQFDFSFVFKFSSNSLRKKEKKLRFAKMKMVRTNEFRFENLNLSADI